MKKLILIIITLFTSLGIVNAGVVPGTIQKGNYESNIFCTAETKTFSPTGGSYSCTRYNNLPNVNCGIKSYPYCYSRSCGTNYNIYYIPIVSAGPGLPPEKSIVGSSCSVGMQGYYLNGTYIPDGYKVTKCTFNSNKYCSSPSCPGTPTYYSCETPSNGCNQYGASQVGSQSYVNYTEKSGIFYFSQSSNTIKLKNDESQYCNAKATVNVTYQPPSSGTWYCPVGNCYPYSISITNPGTGRNAQCSTGYSRDNLITNFDQLGTIQRQYTAYQNKQSCKVEGRYATQDTSGPSISINPVKNVFADDINKWCNINKYRGGIGSGSITEGCKYFRDRGNASGTEDLLKGLEITIGTDPSGIAKVDIIIGACSASYTPNTTGLSSILNSTTSASGVKSQYTAGFTIKYNSSFNALGKNQPSLLSLFGKTRLDECLDEGKNLLIVRTEDLARSENDGVTLQPNKKEEKVSGTINIDNSAPETKTTGDFTDSKNIWKNYTLKGNIEQGEVYKGGGTSTCNTLSGTLLTCPGTLIGGQVWVSPSGVNPTTGKFMSYSCDGGAWKPSAGECKMGCPNGQTWNPNSKKCEGAVCKAFVRGSEAIIENGVNGVVFSPTSCMAYCIPGHSLNCVVKPSGAIAETPTPDPSPETGPRCIASGEDANGVNNKLVNNKLIPPPQTNGWTSKYLMAFGVSYDEFDGGTAIWCQSLSDDYTNLIPKLYMHTRYFIDKGTYGGDYANETYFFKKFSYEFGYLGPIGCGKENWAKVTGIDVNGNISTKLYSQDFGGCGG
ncbi:hypothetical protein H3C61_04595 [Candidatus Gracilibacteria bacterium]|nr:hypothetical protein [Candidatus Gracilibacteria bacterium]